MKPLALCLLASVVIACQPAAPVAYYDTQRVLTESAAGRAAMEAADKAVAGQLAEAQRAATDHNAALKTPVAADALAAKRAQAEKLFKAYQDAAGEARRAAGVKLDETIAAALAKLAAERKLSLVLAVPGKIPYGAAGTDLTTDVIAALDGAAGAELARARAEARAADEKVRRLESAAQAPPDVRHVAASRAP